MIAHLGEPTGRNLLLRAPNGSGKSLALSIYLITQLLGKRTEEGGDTGGEYDLPVEGLVIAPTREIAL